MIKRTEREIEEQVELLSEMLGNLVETLVATGKLSITDLPPSLIESLPARKAATGPLDSLLHDEGLIRLP